MVILVAGPSGVGKSRLVKVACEDLGFATVVPLTTRQGRPDEIDGEDYSFVSEVEFQTRIRSGYFLCWDYILGNYYGYSRELLDRSRRGDRLIVQILARMALRAAEQVTDAHLLFLDASSDRVLDHRLAARNMEKGDLRPRLEHRAEERRHSSMFDVVVRNAAFGSRAELTNVLRRLIQDWE
jgi:guanylate kinase